jgi:hypothetical protein
MSLLCHEAYSQEQLQTVVQKNLKNYILACVYSGTTAECGGEENLKK